MISKVPNLTDSGKALLMRALTGERLTFTRVAIGSGALPAGREASSLTQLINEELSITPINTYYPAPGAIKRAVTIEAGFDGADIENDFTWKELGIYAKVGSREETLYAYVNDGDDAGVIRKMTGNILTEQRLLIALEIGDAQNIGAIVNPHTQYAEASEFQSHVNDTDNPHNVTKVQVGLGNVGNYAPGAAPITFEVPGGTAVPEMGSGETESALFGKAAKAAALLAGHLSGLNPHVIGAGDFAVVGDYTGDGTQGRVIPLSFTPCFLILWNEFGQLYDNTKGVCGGMVFAGTGIRIPSGTASDAETWNNSATALMIVNSGFKVNQLTGASAAASIDTNENGVAYRYIAFMGDFPIEDGEGDTEEDHQEAMS